MGQRPSSGKAGRKKWIIFFLALLLAVGGVLATLIDRPFDKAIAYEQRKFSPDGKPVLVVAYDRQNVINYITIPLEELSGYDGKQVTHFGDLSIRPGEVKKQGDSTILDFEIGDRGVAYKITGFVYSGEQAVTVDRGYDWYIQITTF